MTSVKTPKSQNPTPGEPAPSPFGYKNVPAIEEEIQLSVQGTIPSWVQGIMYRCGMVAKEEREKKKKGKWHTIEVFFLQMRVSGAGKYNILGTNGDTYHITHPFDGLAMLHLFRIDGNSVTYRSRHTSNGLEKRIQDRDPTLLTFGPDPCRTIFGRMQSFFCHLTGFGTDKVACETDPEYELVNVTITPNFPIGPMLERETGVSRGEALVVKRDANTLQLVDRETLRPLKKFTYEQVNPRLKGQLCASHHQFDEVRSEYVNFMVSLVPVLSFQPFVIRSGGEHWAAKVRTCQPITKHLGTASSAIKPAYIHSFSMTEHYIIIPHFPYYYSYGGLSALYYNNAYQTFFWDKNRATTFHVVDRRTGRHVASYDGAPCFSFHSANAWDSVEDVNGKQERVIYMDYCMYENADIVDASFSLGKTSDDASVPSPVDLDRVQPARFVHVDKHTDKKTQHDMKPSEVRRYRLGDVPDVDLDASMRTQPYARQYNPNEWTAIHPPRQSRHAPFTVLATDVELPRFNPKFNLKPYRYVWGVCESKHAPSYATGTVINALIKADLGSPSRVNHENDTIDAPLTRIWDEPGCNCSEPIFLPHPDAAGADQEDHGVVLSIVNRAKDCFLLVLDAATMQELARATIGQFNAMTIHGSFVDAHGVGVAIN
ncbi:carotenoid oxygenase [Gongronella butleri]|nr:carotenoid oxygenase [Gongronella butleri]